MDFTALRYFCETAQSRSVRAASERLHVSPSAISRQIAKLEHELRAPIFDRRAQGMKLTAAGEILQARVEGMIREFARVKSNIAALHDLQAGTVDVYCFQTATENVLAPVLHDFQERYPNVSFNVTMSSTDEAIKAVMDGSAEIGFVVNPPARTTVECTEIFLDTIVAAVSPGHALAGRASVTLEELAKYPMIATVKAFGLRQHIDQVFDRYGIVPTLSCVTNSLDLAKRVAAFDHRCTLLPRLAFREEQQSGALVAVQVAEFAHEPIAFTMCVLNNRSLSPAARIFADAVVEYCQRYRLPARRPSAPPG